MSDSGSFSQRHKFARPKEITVWEDAPAGLRFAVVGTVRDLGWKPSGHSRGFVLGAQDRARAE